MKRRKLCEKEEREEREGGRYARWASDGENGLGIGTWRRESREPLETRLVLIQDARLNTTFEQRHL